jgi:hypothetical protein
MGGTAQSRGRHRAAKLRCFTALVRIWFATRYYSEERDFVDGNTKFGASRLEVDVVHVAPAAYALKFTAFGSFMQACTTNSCTDAQGSSMAGLTRVSPALRPEMRGPTRALPRR